MVHRTCSHVEYAASCKGRVQHVDTRSTLKDHDTEVGRRRTRPIGCGPLPDHFALPVSLLSKLEQVANAKEPSEKAKHLKASSQAQPACHEQHVTPMNESHGHLGS